MPIDRTRFFVKARSNPFGGMLKQGQVNGCNAILDGWERQFVNGDKRWLAYMLATAKWETQHSMQPVREAYYLGEPEPAESYRKTLRYYPHYGRGYVQLTWEDNYRKEGDRLGIDLLSDLDKALDPDIAAKVMFDGMEHGIFTGAGLPLYFSAKTNNPKGARAIINGTDHDEDVADIYYGFWSALT